MDKVTLGIIKALKHNYDKGTLKEIVIDFMSEYSGCPKDIYTTDKVNQIIFQAFADFMDTVDSPRQQLYQLKDSMRLNSYVNHDYDIYDAMLSTMMLVEVCSGDYYINGFNDEYKSQKI